jgi:hypothetical protein
VAPIAGGQKDKIRDLVQQLIASQEPELAAAIRAGVQTRVTQLKAQLSDQVANKVTSQLNRSFSFYDDWFDPVLGLRGRFNRIRQSNPGLPGLSAARIGRFSSRPNRRANARGIGGPKLTNQIRRARQPCVC